MLESCGREMCEGLRYDPSTNEIGSTYMGDDKLCTEMHEKLREKLTKRRGAYSSKYGMLLWILFFIPSLSCANSRHAQSFFSPVQQNNYRSQVSNQQFSLNQWMASIEVIHI